MNLILPDSGEEFGKKVDPEKVHFDLNFEVKDLANEEENIPDRGYHMCRYRQNTHHATATCTTGIKCRAGVKASEPAQLGKGSTRHDDKAGRSSTKHRLKIDDPQTYAFQCSACFPVL